MSESVISHIDHVLVRVERPEPLFSTLTDVLGLPSPWPLSSHPAFASVGVSLGNVDLELVRFGEPSERRPNARLYGLAFDPTAMLTKSQGELKRRGLSHSAVMPYIRRDGDGAPKHLWDNLYVGDLLGENRWQKVFFAATKLFPKRLLSRPNDRDISPVLNRVFPRGMIFLVNYDPEFAENFKRAEAHRSLRERGGGPLGVVGLRDVVIGTQNVDTARSRWNDFLSPIAETTSNRWEFSDGSGVRLIPQKSDRFVALIVEVKSLDRAQTFLATHDMIGHENESSVTIAPSSLAGLNIQLVESVRD